VAQPQRAVSPESAVGVFLAVILHHEQPDVWHALVTVSVGQQLRLHPVQRVSFRTEHRQ
jgi:hypothetical protein